MLAMQEDGHLVQYPDAYWGSGTWGHINVSLNLDEDGHLFLMQGSNGVIIKNITNGFSANGPMFYRLTLNVDGIFRLYSHTLDRNSNWSSIWASSYNGCLAPGLCGLNGYCSTNPIDKKEAACDCLPGFDFIDPTQRTLGCKSNFSSEDCTNNSNHIYYSIDTLRNVVWKNESYSTLQFQAESDCKHDCLEDCNCDVAIFKNGECRKHRFPLKSGRRNPDDPITTLVKVRNESLVSPKDDDIPYTKGPVFYVKGQKELHKDILIISVAFISFVFIVVAVSCVLIYRYRVWRYKKMKDNQHNTELTEEIVLRSFTYDELVKATNNFMEEVGRGAFGTVFKGALDILNGQRLIAVKRLERVVDEGEREFRTEMKVIGRTHHKNLVRLLGYCYDRFHRLLVYEYMSNGSLADLLFKSEVRPYWDERVGIALDIAKGMLYLHEECETQIIHCDIKPQNILMGEHRTAKISDFGLSKLLKQDQTRTFTKIRGTRGYVAPEWHRNLPITLKADVFSFGVVLLEIICCRRSVDTNFPEDEVVLMDWVYDSFEDGELSKLVGDDEVDKRKLERMVKVGIWCIQGEPSLRPSMKKVVLMLEGILDVPVPPSSSSLN